VATVVAIRDETPSAKTYRLALPAAVAMRAGQHFVVRLTAPDGYQASRSYSVASAPSPAPAGTTEIELTVERFPDGEISTFLHEEVVVGDTLEVRGPIGGWFVWEGDAPALLVGGGSGVVPLMAMLRLARREGRSNLLQLVVSVRSPADLYYADEITGPETAVVYTRAAPPDSVRAPGRLTAEDLAPLVRADATSYVCGSPAFCDGVTDLLTALAVPVESIRVERFGDSS
jgi:ferredoxin-NADP reductase